jgi:hypothetical protein
MDGLEFQRLDEAPPSNMGGARHLASRVTNGLEKDAAWLAFRYCPGRRAARAGAPKRNDCAFELRSKQQPGPSGTGLLGGGSSHVRHFKLQAQKFLACPSSCSAWPPLSKAGGTIMKRRLIML